VAEAPRFEARGRPGLHDAAVLGTPFVNRARVKAGLRDVETAAALARVLDEAEVRWPLLEVRVDREEPRPEALFVGLEQVDRAGSMMATATARDAVATFGIRLAFDGRQRH
jgi:hypothetical protein